MHSALALLCSCACKIVYARYGLAARNVRVSYSLIDAARGVSARFALKTQSRRVTGHVIIDGTPGHYRLYSNDHGKFVLDDKFPDWN